jgi:hypothetical protein
LPSTVLPSTVLPSTVLLKTGSLATGSLTTGARLVNWFRSHRAHQSRPPFPSHGTVLKGCLRGQSTCGGTASPLGTTIATIGNPVNTVGH